MNSLCACRGRLSAARLSFVGLVSLAVFGATLLPCQAEPLALRAPIVERHISLAGGVPEVAIGGWILPRVGVAVHARWAIGDKRSSVGAVGASVGTRSQLLGKEKGWRLDAFFSGGVLFTTLKPGFGVTMTLGLMGGYTTDRVVFALGLVSPMALQFFTPVEARLPLLLETWLLFRLGAAWLGVQAAAGAAFVPEYAPVPSIQISGVLGFAWGSLIKNPASASQL